MPRPRLRASARPEPGGASVTRIGEHPAPAADPLSHVAVGRERTRLANALHDGALQHLMVAQQDLVDLTDGRAGALESLTDQLARATAELRALTGALHEESLAEMTFSQAIERLAHAARLRGRMRITAEIEPAADGYHDGILREALRELLANVVTHANAPLARVSVTIAGSVLTLSVTDNGIGFDAEAAETARAEGHLGLPRLTQIAAQLGGTFTIARRTREGTVATLMLPLRALRHRDDLLPAPSEAPPSTDVTARSRLDAADARDQVARRHDLAALNRDRAADIRDLADHQRQEQGLSGSGAGSPERAYEDRSIANAALDREYAARDRERGARERLFALADRETLAGPAM